jgi:SSS family transporter
MSGACYVPGWAGLPPGQPGLAEYYSDVDGVCTKAASFFGGVPVLPESAGYAIVLGFGIFFSIFTTMLMYMDQRYLGTNISSEFFNTAGRSVKTGLTASVIVSQWTWAATLLQSSNVAFQYGVSGPFWYASGATIQVLLFGILAIQVKRYAPTAHTVCEIIEARWGEAAHKVFIYFCFLTNIIVTAMLILGGAATVNALTGMDKTTAGFLIPMGVIAYTMSGGLKATFLASYIHTAIIFVILLTFILLVYVSDTAPLGSPGAVYDALQAVAHKDRVCTWTREGQNCGPVKDNQGGSYLTMMSKGGIIFGIINIVGNFGTVFVDQSYWQSAIAAKPSSSTRGYLLGGLVWFTIPFSLATAMGLATVALDLPVTGNEAGSGLVPPAAAVHFLGKGGAAAITIMLFMAITSTGSAEQIAVSSIVSYDIYRKYINPKATGEQILKVSRYCILGFGIFSGILSVVLEKIGLSLGFVYLMMGIFVGSAVMPVSFLLLWDKANATGAIAGAFCGQALAVITWIVVATFQRDESNGHGSVNIFTLGQNYPMLAGNVVAILSSGLIHAIFSFAAPQNFDFTTLAAKITLIDDVMPDLDPLENDPQMLKDALVYVSRWGVGFAVVMVIIWPLLSLPAGCGDSSTECGVFSKDYFILWVSIAIIWGIVATVVIIVLPIWESMDGINLVMKGLFTNDDVHMRLDIMEAKIDKLVGAITAPEGPFPSDDPCYRAKLINRKPLKA